MWVRKTEQEIALDRNRDRFGFGWPLLWGLSVSVGTFFYSVILAQRWSKAVPISICLGAIASVVAFLYRLCCGKLKGAVLGGKQFVWVDLDAWICSKCHSAKHPRGTVFCKCGGMFEPIEEWKWVEEGCDSPPIKDS